MIASRLPLRLSTLLLLGVGACVAPPRAPAPVDLPRPTPTLALPAPAPVDWQDWPRTPGTWTYQRDARGSRALFGTAGQDARAVLRCDRAERRLFLSRSGGETTPFTIRTTATTRSIAAQPTGGTPPYVATAFAPNDPLLDAMAFSRGRFVIEQAGTPALVLPPYAEVGRVIEDCRG
ncbi:hypothetical protein HRV97_05960 [Sphingomonas sp. HHU CXW]|uniref:Lipoprotein n=1 Tax=Sphingomonas hominis TaxID=2741495 RepID=A0ABX2JE20_9SPHN|nr:hypothetical protein [Sphingomonas hominis]NTS64698.1 hypothetical protein [Sphingomonas hominis]